MPAIWCVVPAAGQGRRFGSKLPKQYYEVNDRPLLAYALDAVLAHPKIAGAMVVLSESDCFWPGWKEYAGKPVLTAIGGESRALSVLAGLTALPPEVRADEFVLVHDAARPNLAREDLDRLLEWGREDPVGAILGVPIRDTLKRVGDDGGIDATQSRDHLWRAFTPQLFRRMQLTRALESAIASNVEITDESMALELVGQRPLLIEGSEDNFKITTTVDLLRFESLLALRNT